jgi:hypothetical protein
MSAARTIESERINGMDAYGQSVGRFCLAYPVFTALELKTDATLGHATAQDNVQFQFKPADKSAGGFLDSLLA